MKVTFNQTRTVQDGTGATYIEGKTYDLTEASARRWIRRGCATPAPASTKATDDPMSTVTEDGSEPKGNGKAKSETAKK